MTTNITTEQIESLRAASAAAGDHAKVLICDIATGDVTFADGLDIRTLRIASFISRGDQIRIAAMDRADAIEACVQAVRS